MQYCINISWISVPTKILVCKRVSKKISGFGMLTMAKLKMNQQVPNKNIDLLKKKQLNGNGELDVLCKT